MKRAKGEKEVTTRAMITMRVKHISYIFTNKKYLKYYII